MGLSTKHHTTDTTRANLGDTVKAGQIWLLDGEPIQITEIDERFISYVWWNKGEYWHEHLKQSDWYGDFYADNMSEKEFKQWCETGEPPSKKEDVVNNPKHYTQGDGIECIDAIKAALTEEEFRGFCKGNVLKYTWREKHKGQDESLQKATWYLNKLLEN